MIQILPFFLFFFFFFSYCLDTHARANFSSSSLFSLSRHGFLSQPRTPTDSLRLPCSLFLSPSHARTHLAQSHTLFRFLSHALFPLAIFIHFPTYSKGATFSFKTIPIHAPRSLCVLIDYDAYCMEKGCPPADGQKGFPA